jgi:hypothetical protein
MEPTAGPSQVTTRISELETTIKSPSPPTIQANPLQAQQNSSIQRPRKMQDDRLVDKEQIGFKCLYEPSKDTADIEYVIPLSPSIQIQHLF